MIGSAAVNIEYRSSSGISERNIQPIGLYASSGSYGQLLVP